eukprot:1177019-Prorocentrum_minimum.AAC.11
MLKAARDEPSAWHLFRPLAASILIFVLGSLCCVGVKSLMDNTDNAKVAAIHPLWINAPGPEFTTPGPTLEQAGPIWISPGYQTRSKRTRVNASGNLEQHCRSCCCW